MIKATLEDKSIVLDVLTRSDSNQSVNYVIKQDNQRLKRIRLLMEYSFRICLESGDVFLSDNREGCALLFYPDKKRNNLKSIIWDLKLALFSIGLTNIPKTLKRESEIKKRHPTTPFTYLWFIGVQPASQGRGVGSLLLNEVLQHVDARNRPVLLETSTQKNVPWYKKLQFEKYDEIDFGYKLFFLKRAW